MDDPWFTMIREPGRVRITPCSTKGWASFVALMIVLMTPLVWVIPHARVSIWAPIAHFVLGLAALMAFVRFARARSEVIDLRELIREARAARRDRTD